MQSPLSITHQFGGFYCRVKIRIVAGVGAQVKDIAVRKFSGRVARDLPEYPVKIPNSIKTAAHGDFRHTYFPVSASAICFSNFDTYSPTQGSGPDRSGAHDLLTYVKFT